MHTIRQTLRTFIIESFLFGRSDQRLSDDDSLIENGIIDSTGVLMLVSFIECDLGVHVEDDEVVPDNLDSVEKLTRFVSRKLGLPSGSEGRPEESATAPAAAATATGF